MHTKQKHILTVTYIYIEMLEKVRHRKFEYPNTFKYSLGIPIPYQVEPVQYVEVEAGLYNFPKVHMPIILASTNNKKRSISSIDPLTFPQLKILLSSSRVKVEGRESSRESE